MEEMTAGFHFPGYKYVPVPKAWDGVFVPSSEEGNLDGSKTIGDIVYVEIKKTAKRENPQFSDNQVAGARYFPTKVVHYVCPPESELPQSVTVRAGPVTSSKRSARVLSAFRKAELQQNLPKISRGKGGQAVAKRRK
jgi:hypothetical protein